MAFLLRKDVSCCSNNGLVVVRYELLLVNCNSNNDLLIIAKCELLLVVNDGFLPARILFDLHQVRLFYLFYARLVKVLDRDGASERVSSDDPKLASTSGCAFSAWASFLIDSSFAKRKPASNASYSALLFEARKPGSQEAKFRGGLVTLELSFFLLTSFSSSANGVNSATKSAKPGLLLQSLAGRGGRIGLALLPTS
ncbi:hypothetical protein L3X38_024273 [Prunus dulcis]|uniref:Uncharacterized protein n=1 Tax=Prunus dulcis TaxID=3755 RepID=A0AAD4VZG4_PRUDU|nr:hypothetical protein L3X38_024273 [Prunus dulcis]